MRVVLTGLTRGGVDAENRCIMRSRLAAISLGYKQPKTRLSAGTKKPVRSKQPKTRLSAGTKKPVRSESDFSLTPAGLNQPGHCARGLIRLAPLTDCPPSVQRAQKSNPLGNLQHLGTPLRRDARSNSVDASPHPFERIEDGAAARANVGSSLPPYPGCPTSAAPTERRVAQSCSLLPSSNAAALFSALRFPRVPISYAERNRLTRTAVSLGFSSGKKWPPFIS